MCLQCFKCSLINRTLDSPIRRENILSPSIDALSNPSDDGDSQTKGHYDWAARRSPTASVNGSRTGLCNEYYAIINECLGFGTQYDEHKSNGMWYMIVVPMIPIYSTCLGVQVL